MTDNANAGASEQEKPSALQVLAGDAERIAKGFVPDVNKLPAIVGALAKQVEQLAGGQLVPLTDELLGIAQEPEPAAAGAGITPDEATALRTQLAEQAEQMKTLQAQIEADRAAAAQIEGAEPSPTSADSEAAK